MATPNEERAIQALKTVQALTGAELQARIDKEVGTPMLGVLDSLAKAVFPEAKKEQHHRHVHLMVLAYLLRGEVEEK